MLVRRERVKTVGIKRIARSTFIHTPRHTETGSFGFATSVPSLSFGNVHPKLLGEEFRQGTVVGRGGSRIEFEGVQSDLDRYGNVELGEREIQLLLPQITKGADNVAPDINRECVAHLHHRDIFLHRNGQNRYVTAREISAHDAAALLRPDDTVGLGLGPANPHALLKAMSERKDWSNLTIGGALILGLFELFTHPNVHYRSGFFGPAERYYRSVGGDVQHVPAGFRQFAPILRRLAPRVMMAQATLPDQHGYVSLSLHHGATFDELRAAGADPNRLLIIEVTPHLPWTSGLDGQTPNRLSLDEIDYVVRSDERPFELPSEPPSDADLAIARHIIDRIPLTATLQTGIGAIPNMVAQALCERPGGEYGIHSEMFTDGLWALSTAGKVTNSHKGVNDGVSVTTFALGSAGLYEWLHENRSVRMAPVSYVNDPTVISQHRNFTSVNGAIGLDLFGQVVADSVAGRQISGVGGHEDFVAGTDLDVDDTSFICLRSTIEVNGVVESRITAQLPPGSVVATPRHHTGLVVTEFGIADLRGATVTERAHALAEIAHPDFRARLHEAAEVLGN